MASRRGLTEPYRGEDDHHSGELPDRRSLTECDPADQHRGERAEEPEDADACDGKESDAAEPDDVGECGANRGEPREPRDVGGRHRRWSAFDSECQRHEHQPAGDELPRCEGEQWDRSPPPLRQHDTRRHRGRAEESGSYSEPVQMSTAAKDEQPDADDAQNPGQQRRPTEPFSEQ